MEMLIYIAILALMLSVIMNIITSTIRSERVIKVVRNIEDSAILASERISREIRQAESADSSIPGKLVLVDGSRTVEFYLSSDRLFLKESINGGVVGDDALTQTDAKVSNLIFHSFSGLNSSGIKTEITIESGTGAHSRSENFYSSALLK